MYIYHIYVPDRYIHPPKVGTYLTLNLYQDILYPPHLLYTLSTPYLQDQSISLLHSFCPNNSSVLQFFCLFPLLCLLTSST